VRCLQFGAALLVLAFAVGLWQPISLAQGGSVPQYRVDPSWPKPLPSAKGADGVPRQWVTGAVGASCIDSGGHVITFNRAYETAYKPGEGPLGPMSVPAPPAIEYDAQGNIVNSWGDAALDAKGGTKTLPRGVHGCFVDHQDNIWVAGFQDGVVQKWSHDGKKMLMQIGEKGVCDGPPTLAPNTPYPTCGAPGNNKSQTHLNNPADMYVDPSPDPVTKQPGSVYIADGYGNHRLVVFDANGKFLRQWGSAGSGPGQFVVTGGGHPHCVTIGNDGLVYVCDRGNNRIQVFDKMGAVKRIYDIAPPQYMKQRVSGSVANDFTFSRDKNQSLMFDADLGAYVIWIMNRESGQVVGSFGSPGRNAGHFILPHSIDMDASNNIYVGETGTGNRIQKFVPGK
jgi:sugar lactone lactonase YvrE